MKKLLIATLLWILAAVPGFAQEAQPFSADMTVTAGENTHQGKIFVGTGGKVRMETNMRDQKVITIVRPDRQATYMVMPLQKMYLQVPIRPEDTAVTATSGANATITKVGTEKVNGEDCDKYKVESDGKTSGYIWRSQKTGFPVRFEGPDGKSRMDYTNLKIGPQPNGLFEPPAGYQKMDIPQMPPSR